MPRPPRREPADQPQAITSALLRSWPLPLPPTSGDKRSRGMVVCVGGSPELPGAMVLAGTAALRAGAGTVRLGVPLGIGIPIGVAVPEALVFALPTARDGGFRVPAAMEIADRANGAAAVLIGPGMTGGASVSRLLRATLPTLRDSGVVILDAHALDGAPGAVEAVRGCAPRALLTPHAGEMARLLDVERHDVETHPVELGHKAAEIFQAVVVLKGARTTVSTPEGACYQYDEGDIGLATSGSGDTLSGIIAGLAARGADASQAAVWGVFLHGSAGNHLRQRIGRLGFLARELLDEVPQIIAELDHKPLAESRRRRNLPGR